MKAADVMCTNVITIHPDASIMAIAQTLLDHRISAVPVVDDDGFLCGILSEGDLIHRTETGTERHRAWWLEFFVGKDVLAREFVKSHGRKAADLMTRTVVTVNPNTPLGELAALLDKHRIKRVPVVEGGKIVGIVSRADLVRAVMKLAVETKNANSVSDSELRANILGQLQSQPWWSNKANIIVEDGNVELWGAFDSQAIIEAIDVAVAETPGVRNISNNLTVEFRLSAQ